MTVYLVLYDSAAWRLGSRRFPELTQGKRAFLRYFFPAQPIVTKPSFPGVFSGDILSSGIAAPQRIEGPPWNTVEFGYML